MRALVGILLCTALFAAAADQPPPFKIERVGGAAPLTLAGYRGKVVMLALISTTCPHCQKLTGDLIPVAKEYGPRGVQFLGCAFNDDAQNLVAAFIMQFQPAFPVGWATRDAVYTLLGRSVLDQRPLYVPHLLFLDRAGKVQADVAGESDFMNNAIDNIRGELDRLLGAVSASKTAKSAGKNSTARSPR